MVKELVSPSGRGCIQIFEKELNLDNLEKTIIEGMRGTHALSVNAISLE